MSQTPEQSPSAIFLIATQWKPLAFARLLRDTILVIGLFATNIPHVNATTWTAVTGSEHGTQIIEFDADSLIPLPSGGSLTWRKLTPSQLGDRGDSYTQYQSVANCKEHSLEHKLSSDVFWNGRVFRSYDYSNDYLNTRFDFPSWTYHTGLLLREVCPKLMSDWGELWSDTSFISNCDSAAHNVDRLICQDPDVRGEFNLLIHRMALAGNRCNYRSEDSNIVLGHTIKKANECVPSRSTSLSQCMKNRFVSQHNEFSKDLKSLYSGGKCSVMQATLKSISEEAAEKERHDRTVLGLFVYYKCAKTAVATVDDNTSSAEVVATALHSKCYSEFSAATKDLGVGVVAAIERTTRLKLIEMVFDWRYKSRQPVTPK